jgi:hypothetical protein
MLLHMASLLVLADHILLLLSWTSSVCLLATAV